MMIMGQALLHIASTGADVTVTESDVRIPDPVRF